MTISSFPNTESFIYSSVNLITDILKRIPTEKHIALSGGSTPFPIYQKWGEENCDFSNTTFYLADERYVPVNDKNSNAKLINKSLGKSNFGKSARYEYFETDLPLENCLDDYELRLRLIPDKSLDLCILGIGPDGHFASIFPYTKFDDSELVAHTTTEEFAIFDRLTMTPQMILNSKHLIILLKGSKKKTVLDRFLHHESIQDIEFPAGMLKQHPRLSVLFCPED